MPRCEETGKVVHLISNSLGVINRLNIAQIFEQEINAMSEVIEGRLLEMYNESGDITTDMEDLLFNYIDSLNHKQKDKTLSIYEKLNEDQLKEFWKGILYGDGILIEQGPMTDNVNLLELFQIYDKYGINIKRKLEGIENEIIVGDVYYMTLRHHPKTKFSVRSGGFVDQKSLPSKSMAYSKKEAPHQSTAIRLGEMEVNNLFIIKDVKAVVNMLSMYSTNAFDREVMTQHLLTKNPFDIDKIENTGTVDRTSDILDVILKGIGLELSMEDEE